MAISVGCLDQEGAAPFLAGAGPEGLAAGKVRSNRVRYQGETAVTGELRVHIVEFAFRLVEEGDIALLNRIRVADVGRRKDIRRNTAVTGDIEDVVGMADIQPQFSVNLGGRHDLAVIDQVMHLEGRFLVAVEQGAVLFGHFEGEGIQGKQVLVGSHQDERLVIDGAVRPDHGKHGIDFPVHGLAVCQLVNVPCIAGNIAGIAVGYVFVCKKVEVGCLAAVPGVGDQDSFPEGRAHENVAEGRLEKAALPVGRREGQAIRCLIGLVGHTVGDVGRFRNVDTVPAVARFEVDGPRVVEAVVCFSAQRHGRMQGDFLSEVGFQRVRDPADFDFGNDLVSRRAEVLIAGEQQRERKNE